MTVKKTIDDLLAQALADPRYSSDGNFRSGVEGELQRIQDESAPNPDVD